MPKETKEDKKRNQAGLFIPAGLFIGLGFGFLFNQIVAGVLLGLGAGFLVFGIVSVAKK